MNNPSKRKATTLSSYVWDLKDSSIPYHLRWSILTRAQPYCGSLRDCNLCSEGALRILLADYPLLNKRSELVISCRHISLRAFSHYGPHTQILTSAGCNRLEKKASGCHASSMRCCKTPPTPTSDASTTRLRGASVLGCVNIYIMLHNLKM